MRPTKGGPKQPAPTNQPINQPTKSFLCVTLTHLCVRSASVVRQIKCPDEHGEKVYDEGHGGVEHGADLTDDALALRREKDLGLRIVVGYVWKNGGLVCLGFSWCALKNWWRRWLIRVGMSGVPDLA